jgi:hypothetical protein
LVGAAAFEDVLVVDSEPPELTGMTVVEVIAAVEVNEGDITVSVFNALDEVAVPLVEGAEAAELDESAAEAKAAQRARRRDLDETMMECEVKRLDV